MEEDGMGEAVAPVGEEARVEDHVSLSCKQSTAYWSGRPSF